MQSKTSSSHQKIKIIQRKNWIKQNQEIAEATGDFVGNKIANGITKVSRSSPQNNSETVKN